MEREGLAVLLNEAGTVATVEEITLDPPGPGEVQIKLAASGVCHTDLHVKTMNGMGMAFPIVLGHEGAGYVEEVGEGVTHLAVGDPVVIAYRAPCEQCPARRRGDPRRLLGSASSEAAHPQAARWRPLLAGSALRDIRDPHDCPRQSRH